jgi:hypothetical protein
MWGGVLCSASRCVGSPPLHTPTLSRFITLPLPIPLALSTPPPGANPLAASADGKLPLDCVESSTPLIAETLKSLLEKAADKAKKSGGKVVAGGAAAATSGTGSATAARASKGAAGGKGAEDEGVGGVEGYAEMFGRLADQEQERRVDGFARMMEADVKGLDFLRPEAKEAIGQVRV